MNTIPDPILTTEIIQHFDYHTIISLSLTCKKFNKVLLKAVDDGKLVKKRLFLTQKEFYFLSTRLTPLTIIPDIKFRLLPVYSQNCIYRYQRGRFQDDMCGKLTDQNCGNYCRLCANKRTVTKVPQETFAMSPVFVKYAMGRVPNMKIKIQPEFMYHNNAVHTFKSVHNLGTVVGKLITIFGLKYVTPI